jgi:hypothetical protein
MASYLLHVFVLEEENVLRVAFGGLPEFQNMFPERTETHWNTEYRNTETSDHDLFVKKQSLSQLLWIIQHY